MAKKVQIKSRKGKKKGNGEPRPVIVMPGLPYGADPWIEAQPVPLADVPLGHIKTVFPVRLVMPTKVYDAQDNAQADIMAAVAEAEVADAFWEKACEEVEYSLQIVKDRASHHHDTNVFLEKLLSTNETDTDMSLKFLSDSSVKLHGHVLEMEERLKKAQLEADSQLRLCEEKHKVITADFEKILADRDKRLYELALEHIDLQKLEEDRDAMQLAVDELRNSVYANEKQHRTAVMQADETRRKTQRKAQEDSQAALEDLAKRGCEAAQENITRQTKKLNADTDRLSDLFKWICQDVRKNRSGVRQLQQLLEDCILDHDSVVSACEAKLRQFSAAKTKLNTLQVLTECVEKEQQTALAMLKKDSETVFNSIEHSFYDRDKEIMRLKNNNEAIHSELCKLKSTVAETTSSHSLVERFIVSSLHEIKTQRNRQIFRADKKALENYGLQLKQAWAGKSKYPSIRLFRSVQVNQTLKQYRPPPIPDHSDISELGWKQKEAVVETMFRYLCEYHSMSTAV